MVVPTPCQFPLLAARYASAVQAGPSRQVRQCAPSLGVVGQHGDLRLVIVGMPLAVADSCHCRVHRDLHHSFHHLSHSLAAAECCCTGGDVHHCSR